jgi:hypothetical protein
MTSSKAIFCVRKSLVVASEFKEQNKIELNDLWIVPIQTCTYSYIIQLKWPPFLKWQTYFYIFSNIL